MPSWLTSSLRDLRHGVVLLWRDAGVSAAIVLVLALGIGGTSAIFTLLDAAFVAPLPYRDATALVTVLERHSKLFIDEFGPDPSISEFLEIRDRSRTLSQIAFIDHRDFQLVGGSEPLRVFAARVTASFFPLLGVNASLGRTFSEEENELGWDRVVVLSHAFWASRMGADPNVLGRTLQLNDNLFTVVGVLPAGFSFDHPTLGVPERTEIYVPFPMQESYPLHSSISGLDQPVRVIARLSAGTALKGAAAELQNIADSLAQEHPSEYLGPDGGPSGFTLRALPLRDAIVGTQRSLLWLLLGSVCVLLMIACANTAQLLLARGLRRSPEVAIRAALGASRSRLIRQFLLEGLVLALCAGVSGLFLSAWLARLIVRFLPVSSPLLESVHMNAHIVEFTLLVSFSSALIFATVPAVKGSKWNLGAGLTVRMPGRRNRWGYAMVGLEVALSVFLMCGAGLVGQNLRSLILTPAGFDPSGVLVMQMRLSPQRERAIRPIASIAYQEYLARIAATGGVDAAAIVTGPPTRPSSGAFFALVGNPDSSGPSSQQPAFVHKISSDYFRTLRIPLVAGRTFRDDDILGRPGVVIVNQEFVRRLGISQNPIGRKIGPGEPFTIVGVVGDVRMRGLETAPFPEVYYSYLQVFDPNIYLVVRSQMPQGQLVSSVKSAIRSSDSDQAIFNVSTMEELFASSLAEPRFQTLLIGAFALLALAMAAGGMYSVIGCLVSQRTSEIAIRIALGASRSAIARTVLGNVSAWIVAGLGVGLGLGLIASAPIRELSNSEVTGSLPMYLMVVVFSLVIPLAAAYAPVRRASSLDPAVALRNE